MKAIVIHAPRDLRYEDAPTQTLGAGDVRVKIGVGGICGSDLHYYRHGGFGSVRLRQPMILGHEIAGEIIETGVEVSSLSVRQRVVVNPSLPCGVCSYCRKGLSNHCSDMRFYGSAMRWPHVDGGFREELVCKAEQAFPVPDSLTLNEAAFAEPLAVCLHAVQRPGSLLGKKVLVSGAGPIGLLTSLVARSAGAAAITITDILDEPLRLAAECGIDETVNIAKEPERLAAFAQGKGVFDVVFEASGSAEATISSLNVVVPCGTVVCIGQGAQAQLNVSAIVTKEVNLLGAFRFRNEFPMALDYVARNRSLVGKLLTASIPASDPVAAFEYAADKTRSMKIHLEF
jgi:L-idonate 5-dehydrogenase